MPALLLLALATGLVLLAPSPPVPEPAHGPASLPVRHLLLGCPGSTPATAWKPEVRLGSAPVPAASVSSVRMTTPGEESVVGLTSGELVEVPVAGGGGLTLEAEDAAAGLFAVQTGATGRTLAATRCAVPAATWWFSAAGGTLAHASELVLDNLDAGPAVVDLRVLGPAGLVETLDSRGLTVPPGERLVVPLPELAPQSEELTVQVTATRGRVVAAVADRFAERLGGAAGSAWLPPQDAPRRRHRLPGLVPDAAAHTLVVTNPGENEALVDLEVSSQSGTFTPTGETQLRVPPGTVVIQDVSDLVAADAGALVVRASVPVLSTVRARSRTDTTYLASADRLTGPAAVTATPGTRTVLTLTAGDSGGRATVTSYSRTGAEIDTGTVDLVAGATVRSRPARRAAYVVVTPQRGDLGGAVTWSERTGVAGLPLAAVPVRMRQPAVEPAY